MKKIKISILFLVLLLLLIGTLSTACGQPTDDKMANYSDEEKIIVSFLNTVYSSTEEDVKKHGAFREYVDQLANSSNLQSIELSEGNDYYIYLKNKYQLTDDLFDKLMANRQADYYIKKSFEEGVLYAPDEINLEYVNSLKSYKYQVLMNDKTFKGIVRLENKKIAGFEIEIVN